MGLKKGETIEVQVKRMAYGGKGVARIDNFVIFVRGAIPGDRVKATIFKKRKGFAEARMVDLLSPSPDRVEASCPYSAHCGGCQWQHVNYEAQLSYKREHIKESLTHIAGLENIPVLSVLPSRSKFAYRNKMEFSFSDSRWLLPGELGDSRANTAFALGLHTPGAYQKVLDIDACLLQEQEGNEILRTLKEIARKSSFPPYGIKSHRGFWRFLTLRYSVAFDEWMVNIVTARDRPDSLSLLAKDLCSKFPKIKTVVNNINRRKASIAVGEDEQVFWGNGYIEDKIGPLIFRVSANSFFQTNSRTAEDLYAQVVQYGELKETDRVVDLYSGTGTIPLLLSPHVREVIGIEINEGAVQDARRNAEKNNMANCRFLCGDIREKIPSLPYEPDVLIIDPPRAGMHKDVLAGVLELAPERIVYVSCNPATLSRDLGDLAQQYEIIEIQPVDMFPHTYHIETVAKLVRKK